MVRVVKMKIWDLNSNRTLHKSARNVYTGWDLFFMWTQLLWDFSYLSGCLWSLFMAQSIFLSFRLLLNVHLGGAKPPGAQHTWKRMNIVHTRSLTLHKMGGKSVSLLSLVFLKSILLLSLLFYSYSGPHHFLLGRCSSLLNCISVMFI